MGFEEDFLALGIPSRSCSLHAVHPINEVHIGGVLQKPPWGFARGDEKVPASQGCREQSLWLSLEARTSV